MKYPRTAEGYAEYLKSGHWDILRSAVLARDDFKCCKCGKRGFQVHHVRYRDDWEDGRPEDCVTVCRSCHEKEHPDKQIKPAPKPAPDIFLGTQEAVEQARKDLAISRQEFLELKEKLSALGRWTGIPKKNNNRKWLSNFKRRHKFKTKSTNGCKPWFYSPRRMHWVNRGTSSN